MESRHRSGDEPLRLTMLGPSPDHPGGITKVVDSWRKGGLERLVSLREIHTSRWDDSLPRQVVNAVIALWTLLLLLVRRETDVLYLHVSTGGSTGRKLAAALLARLFRVPYVAQIHSGNFGTWVAESRLARACSRSLFSNAAAAVVVSGHWSELARRLGAAEVVVLHNALCADEREAFAAAAAAAGPPPRPTLLYYGRWSPIKGPDRIAGALATLLPADYEVRLFGNGDRAWLEDAFAALPPATVKIGGWIGLSDKAAELAAATALVVPSRSEGFGQVLLEARAAGVPVVASDVGAVAEVLDGYSRALLVPAGDDAALAAALGRVLAGEWPPPGDRDGRIPDLPERFHVEPVVTELAAMLADITEDGGIPAEPSFRLR